MHRILGTIIIFLSILSITGCKSHKILADEAFQVHGDSLYIPGGYEYAAWIESRYTSMETELKTYIHDKDARLGVAVIINGADTVSVNGRHHFPMLSVYKFPQALAVADYCSRNNISLDDNIRITADEMSKKYRYNDLGIIEKVIRAFALLDLLARSGCPYIFKGGTCVGLILGNKTRRLSIYIDIICPPGTNVEEYLDRIGEFGFTRKELVERRHAGKDIPKSHSKFFYQITLVRDKTDSTFSESVLSRTSVMRTNTS